MDFDQQNNQSRLEDDGPLLYRSDNLDFTNQNVNQTLTDAGNAVINYSPKYNGYHNVGASYQNWYNTSQNFHAPLHIDSRDMIPPLYGCHFLTPSYNSSLPIPWAGSSASYLALSENQAIGVPSTEYTVSSRLDKIVGKNYEREYTTIAPLNYSSASTTSEFSSFYASRNSELQSLVELNGSLHSSSSAAVPPGAFMGSSSFNLRPESAYPHCFNGVPSAYFHPHCFGPSRNGGPHVGQASASNGCSYWNLPAFTCLPGGYIQSQYVSMASDPLQVYKDTRLYEPSSYEDERLLHNQVHSRTRHSGSQIPAVTYQQPSIRNFQYGSAYPSLSVHNFAPRLTPGHFVGEQIHSSFVRPVHTLSAVGPRNVSRLSLETNADHEVSSIYGLEDTIDEHREMRLDIDGMSYEELLALEEQIGNVRTGLTKEFVMKNLVTCIHGHKLPSSPSDDEFCAVCQVEYTEGDSLGILSCGHRYHSSCIRQWLLIKNLCPICKKSGLAIGRRNG